jgi:hypothetical protein
MGNIGGEFLKNPVLETWLRDKRLGGQYLRESIWTVLDQHPLPALAKRYTAGDTAYLFDMHDVYRKRNGTVFEAFRRTGRTTDIQNMVNTESMNRVRASESPDFEGPNGNFASGPLSNLEWIWADGKVKTAADDLAKLQEARRYARRLYNQERKNRKQKTQKRKQRRKQTKIRRRRRKHIRNKSKKRRSS